MLIISTSISGSGRKEFLNEFETVAARYGKKVKIYHVGQMIFDQANKVGVNITHENVLNANPYLINSLRSAVFEMIIAELPRMVKTHDAVIINIHSFFFWKKIFMRAYDRFYVNELNPDMFVTFIDDTSAIQQRLNKRTQWVSQKLSSEELLLWQNVEVEVTASWAEFHRKDFYVMSVKQPMHGLYRLLFKKNIEPVYISMPMTHLPPEDQLKVSKFVKKLESYFVVFDPRTIEIATASARKADATTYNQTVTRDLYWLVKQSKKIIAYFPRLVSSPGAINELREGYETNKDVWIVYPQKLASPFLTYFSSRIFKSENEFFKFLGKHHKKHKLYE
jgi:adenylate kinase